MNFSVNDIIYLMKGSGYDKEYMGETSTFILRVRFHKQQIFDPRSQYLYVSRHIAHCALGKEIPFKIIPFFSLNRDDRTFRKETEHHFIRKIHPELNQDI